MHDAEKRSYTLTILPGLTLGALEAPRKAIIYILKRMTFILEVPFQAFVVASLVAAGKSTVPHVTSLQGRKEAHPEHESPGSLPP